MSYNGHTYYIILRKKSRVTEVLYNIGSESSVTTVLRLSGRNANKVFRDVIEALARQGATVPLRVSDSEQVYSVREDLGPVVGAYLILVRRARSIEKWSRLFNELLDGRYAGVAKAFSAFFELAIELSRTVPRMRRDGGYAISPVVADALSSALKRFVDKVAKAYPE